MCRRLTTVSTLVTMLLHALLGCCCHDGHAGETCVGAGNEHKSSPVRAIGKSGCSCHAHHGAESKEADSLQSGDEADRPHHPHELCSEARCRFVRTSDSTPELRMLQATLADLPPSSHSQTDVSNRPFAGTWRTVPVIIAASVRLRAQVWLL